MHDRSSKENGGGPPMYFHNQHKKTENSQDCASKINNRGQLTLILFSQGQ